MPGHGMATVHIIKFIIIESNSWESEKEWFLWLGFSCVLTDSCNLCRGLCVQGHCCILPQALQCKLKERKSVPTQSVVEGNM